MKTFLDSTSCGQILQSLFSCTSCRVLPHPEALDCSGGSDVQMDLAPAFLAKCQVVFEELKNGKSQHFSPESFKENLISWVFALNHEGKAAEYKQNFSETQKLSSALGALEHAKAVYKEEMMSVGGILESSKISEIFAGHAAARTALVDADLQVRCFLLFV